MPEYDTNLDPFATDDKETAEPKGKAQMKATVKRAEGGTYTQATFPTANPNAQMQHTAAGLESFKLPAPTADQLEGTYSRVEELAESTGFFKLEEIEERDVIVLSLTPGLSAQYKNADGTPSEYCVMEFLFVDPNDNPDPDRGEPPFNSVVGGIALSRLKSAAKAIVAGKATGPLVAAFEKRTTAAGNSFWNVR